MNYPMAIVVAGALVAGAVLVSCVQAQAPPGTANWYQIAVTQDGKVWRLNSGTGELTFCSSSNCRKPSDQ